MRSVFRVVTTLALISLPVVVPAASAAVPPGVVAVCDGVPATIVGTSGDDVLRGTAGRDVVQAFEGDDLVRGLAGDDLLCGGVGADQLDGGRGDDVLWGGSDSDPATSLEPAGDVLVGGPQDDVLHGGATPDDGDGLGVSYRLDVAEYSAALSPLVARFVGGSRNVVRGQGRDRLDGIYVFSGGRADDDVVVVRQEMEAVLGGDGDDHLDVKAVGSTTDGGPGDDVVERGYVVVGGHGADRLLGPVRRGSGGIGPDVLVGRNDQSDRLAGDGGRDLLRGLGGDDRLDGGGGLDTVDGGAGRDTCTTGERLTSCEA